MVKAKLELTFVPNDEPMTFDVQAQWFVEPICFLEPVKATRALLSDMDQEIVQTILAEDHWFSIANVAMKFHRLQEPLRLTEAIMGVHDPVGLQAYTAFPWVQDRTIVESMLHQELPALSKDRADLSAAIEVLDVNCRSGVSAADAMVNALRSTRFLSMFRESTFFFVADYGSQSSNHEKISMRRSVEHSLRTRTPCHGVYFDAPAGICSGHILELNDWERDGNWVDIQTSHSGKIPQRNPIPCKFSKRSPINGAQYDPIDRRSP